MISEVNKEKATAVVEAVVNVIHERQYDTIKTIVDSVELDINELFEFVDGTLKLNEFESIDQYDIPCNFKPAYEYSQLEFYEYNNGSGFAVDYALTSHGELVDMVLQLEFIYTDTEMKSVLLNVDPQ